LLERVRRETIGLGPLEELLADPGVDEVLVNRHDEVWIEREGRLQRCDLRFDDTAHLRDVIERILGPLGRRVDELSPMADGRLVDGSRVNVVIPPLAVDGPALSIRRFVGVRHGVGELVARDTLPAALLGRLSVAVRDGHNLLISGGTGSGKTTVLNALASFIPELERVITIEDAAELRLTRPHVVRLETRPASVEGAAAVSIRDLVRNALRMRPDRIVIGEVRGAEAMDLLLALNTGHRGALTTVHANSPADAITRIEALAMMADIGLDPVSLRGRIAAALDLVLHLERGPEGDRRATALAEVVGTSSGIGVQEVWAR
jgi:pilus assembly protein CpaF